MSKRRSSIAYLPLVFLLVGFLALAGYASIEQFRAALTRLSIDMTAVLPRADSRLSSSGSVQSASGSFPLQSDSVQLRFVSLMGGQGSVRVKYSKNFSLCAQLMDENRRVLHRANFFCKNGEGVTIDLALTQLSLKLGQRVMLCKKNDPTVCSDLAVVGDSILACGNGLVETSLGEECDGTPCTVGRICSAYCKCAAPFSADLALTLLSPESVDGSLSTSITYTMTVFNAGPGTAERITINNPVPRGLTLIGSASDALCRGTTASTVLCDGFDLASGQFRTLVATFGVPAKELCGTWVQNIANVSAASLDPNSKDNQRLTRTWVNCASLCGNGKLEAGEWCDDGNRRNTDGCSMTCTIEGGWQCTQILGVRSICTSVCGDGVKKGYEECEKGIPCSAAYPGKACNEALCRCITPVCGDRVRVGDEQCERGVPCSGEYADQACDETSCRCVPALCRNGALEVYEQCETGMFFSRCLLGQECDLRSCKCIPKQCGNVVLSPGEQCDDGNREVGDGCSKFCRVESGWWCTKANAWSESVCKRIIRSSASSRASP